MADNISLSASLGLGNSFGQGKVRAMFQARRTTASSSSLHSSPVGWDKSYPLNPISRSLTGSHAGSTASSTSSTTTARGTVRRKQRSRKSVSRSRSEHRPTDPNSQHPSRSRSQGNARADRKPTEPVRSVVSKPQQRQQQQKINNTNPPRPREVANVGRKKMMEKMKRRDKELLDEIHNTEYRKPPELQPRTPKVNPSRRVQSKKQPVTSSNNSRPPSAKNVIVQRSENRRAPSSARSRTSTRSYRSSSSKENQIRPPPTDPNMAQCPHCTRHFAVERLDKHKDICEKSFSKKRKEFDPIKMRVQGTESERFLQKIKDTEITQEMPRQDWRKEHEEFVSTIRAAKQAQSHLAAGGSLKDLPPPPPSDNSHYIECPHCNRRFNKAAADRHIPKCAAIVSNKPATVAAKRRR